MVRIKYRYLLVNILYPSEVPPNPKISEKDVPDLVKFHRPGPAEFLAPDLRRLIVKGVNELFGDYGGGTISGSLFVKYFSAATSTAIVRVSRDHYRLVWAALSFATQLPKPHGTPCVFQVVRVSGTIKKCEEEAIKRARQTVRRARIEAQTSGSDAFNALVMTVTDQNAKFSDEEDSDDETEGDGSRSD